MHNTMVGAIAGGLTDAGQVVITNRTITHSVTSPSNALAGLRLRNDGVLQENRGNALTTISGEWQDPQGSAPGADFDVRVTVSTGVTPAGEAVNAWLNLGTTREWRVTEGRDGLFSTSSTLFVEIRDAATGAVLNSATITLNAAVFSST